MEVEVKLIYTICQPPLKVELVMELSFKEVLGATMQP